MGEVKMQEQQFYEHDDASTLLVKRRKETGILGILPEKGIEMPDATFAQIEITRLCNFKCPICSRESLAPESLKQYMTPEHIKHILDDMPGLKGVRLQGLGEPLMTPQLDKILEIARAKGLYISTISNGSLLRVPKYMELALKFDDINISIDSTDPRKFAEIRIGGNLPSITEGLKRMVQAKKDRGLKTKINISMIATHLNYMEIPSLYGFAASLGGIDTVYVTEVQNWYIPGQKEYEEANAFIAKSREKSKEIENMFLELKAKLEPLGISAFFISALKRKEKCRWPFDSAFITADGYVTPCCKRMDKDVFNLGNVYQTKFSEIWNGKGYKEFRDTLINGKPNIICDDCPGCPR